VNLVLEKLQAVEDKYMELESLISDPDTIQDIERWQRYSKEHASLTPVVEKFRVYKKVVQGIADDRAMFDEPLDDEMRKLVEEELADFQQQKAVLDQELPILLLPKDPNDDKNVIVEIRGGVGGDEAALFAGDLFRMYSRFAERQGWRTELIDANATEIGGFKEVSFMVTGFGAYSKLKYESGTHRVQRVPVTESGGRIHTSAVTVAVLPEVEDVEVEINPNDLRIDTYCASGAGGQYVNRTETAIRITHLPTGIVVQCQDEKSQLKNKEKAMKVLRARVLDQARQAQEHAVAADRRSQVGSGDRSERIRTYNFPQGRVTDHRIGLTLHRIDAVMNGELDEILNALITADQAERLKQVK
jgi:peptide chain release factor 1